jgi:hypothetical protein
MQVLLVILYIGLGLLQLAAIQAGLTAWLGLHWLLAIILSVILAWMPLIGSILGFVGAMKGWHWDWWQAGLLFFGIPLAGIIFALVSAGTAGIADWFARRRALRG